MKKVTLKPILLTASIIALSGIYAVETKIEKQPTAEMLAKDNKEAEKVLMNYLKAGDESNVEQLDKLTHKFYRVIFKDVSNNEVSEINRSTYLDLIEKKVFGGNPRKVEILESNLSENNIASFKVKTSSEGVIFISYFSLINDKGSWLVLQDLIYKK